MDTLTLIEIFGYIGSTLVVVSMLMSSVVKLRIINTIGSTVSGTYAFIIGSFPLMLMNFCLVVINIYNLYRLLKTEQKYDLVDTKSDDTFVKYFLERYKEDIKIYFPAFTDDKIHNQKAYMICCDGNPAGILLGEEKEAGTLDIIIDYSTPAYRDCSVGKFLYSKLPSKGVNTLKFSQSESKTHISYMNKMEFTKENNCYIKKL